MLWGPKKTNNNNTKHFLGYVLVKTQQALSAHNYICTRLSPPTMTEKIFLIISFLIFFAHLISLHYLHFSFFTATVILNFKTVAPFVVFVRGFITIFELYYMPVDTDIKKPDLLLFIKDLYICLTLLQILFLITCFIYLSYGCALLEIQTELWNELKKENNALEAVLARRNK